jgi:hypothetical protein
MVLATLLLNNLFADFSDPMSSPFVVPVAGCVMILGIVVVSIWSGTRHREMESQERLAAIAKGLVPPPTKDEREVASVFQGPPTLNALRKRNSVRTGGWVLVGIGTGIILTCALIAFIVRERDVLCGSAAGLIPLGIGVGLLIDAQIQTRELEAASVNSTSLIR